MKSKLSGTITIPKGSYQGCGEAVLFLRRNNQSICDKVLYFKDMDGIEFDAEGNIKNMPAFATESDEFYHPLKVMMSSWQACVPSLRIHYDLVETDNTR